MVRKFSDRAEQILSLRTVHEQLLTQLNNTEIQELRVKEAFIPFNAVIPLNVTEVMDAPWARAVKDYERYSWHGQICARVEVPLGPSNH